MFLTPTRSCAKSFCPCTESAPRPPTRSCCMPGIILSSSWTPTHTGSSDGTESPAASRTMKKFAPCSKVHFRGSRLFNEFHALIVNTGKNWCRKSAPRCGVPAPVPAAGGFPLSTLARVAPEHEPLLPGSARHEHQPQIAALAGHRRRDRRFAAGGSLHARLAHASLRAAWIKSFSMRFPRFIVAALLVFLLVLVRTLVRLWRGTARASRARGSKPRWFSGPWPFRFCP